MKCDHIVTLPQNLLHADHILVARSQHVQIKRLCVCCKKYSLTEFREQNERVRCRKGDQEVVLCIINTFLYKTTQTSQNTPLQTVFNEAERRSYLNKCRAGLAWLVLTDENTRRLSL